MNSLYRAISTLCISLVVGGLTLGVAFFILLQFGYHMDESTPNFVVFMTGFVVILLFHQRIHRIRCVYRVLGIAGIFVVLGGIITCVLSYTLDKSHQPIGPLDGIQYFFLMLLGATIIVSGFLLVASCGLGYLSRKQIAE
jgi:FtsH-binding integral membrane protein